MSTDSQGPQGPAWSPGEAAEGQHGVSLQVRLTRVPVLIPPLAACVSSGKWLSLSESGFPPLLPVLMGGREDLVL